MKVKDSMRQALTPWSADCIKSRMKLGVELEDSNRILIDVTCRLGLEKAIILPIIAQKQEPIIVLTDKFIDLFILAAILNLLS